MKKPLQERDWTAVQQATFDLNDLSDRIFSLLYNPRCETHYGDFDAILQLFDARIDSLKAAVSRVTVGLRNYEAVARWQADESVSGK